MNRRGAAAAFCVERAQLSTSQRESSQRNQLSPRLHTIHLDYREVNKDIRIGGIDAAIA